MTVIECDQNETTGTSDASRTEMLFQEVSIKGTSTNVDLKRHEAAKSSWKFVNLLNVVSFGTRRTLWRRRSEVDTRLRERESDPHVVRFL